MTPEQFAYWLQGYAEIVGKRPSAAQWQVMQDHLKTVFHKVTPDGQIVGTNLQPNSYTDLLKDFAHKLKDRQITAVC